MIPGHRSAPAFRRRSAAATAAAALVVAALVPAGAEEVSPPAPPAAAPGSLRQDFDAPDTGTAYALSRTGAEPGPVVEGGALLLVNGGRSRGPLANAIAFPRTTEGCARRIVARFRFSLSRGGLGGALALLDTSVHGVEGAAPAPSSWDEPDLPGAFCVALDTYEPPTAHWFDGFGNVHVRPERTVSLHWNGREIANVLSPVEFRDEGDHRFELDLRFRNGGADATVRIDDTAVVDDRFLPGVTPFEARVALGAATGTTACRFLVDDLVVEFEDPGPAERIAADPIRVRTLDAAPVVVGADTARGFFDLPGRDRSFERVLLRLTLGPAPAGWDIWDRRGAVYVYRPRPGGGGEEAIEIARFMTPFAREYSWTVDVTDFLPLLRGRAELGAWISTLSERTADVTKRKGFAVTVDLEYFPGVPARNPIEVGVLVDTRFDFRGGRNSLSDAFPAFTRAVPEGSVAARIRTLSTGHGGYGEFTPSDRSLTVNGIRHENRQWTTDCWLNPCRPQGGTWKFDRAGWAPGSIVEPWIVAATPWLRAGQPLEVRYLPRPYADPPEGYEADLWVQSVVIFYGEDSRSVRPDRDSSPR